MKRWATMMLMACGGNALFALPLDNPAAANLYTDSVWTNVECNIWNTRIGFYGDYVFNRYMETEENDHLERFALYTNAGYIALNINDKIDVFATLGVTNMSVDVEVVTSTLAHLTFVPEFSWSVGGHVTLWKYRCWYLGFEGQYFRTNPKFDYLFLDTYTYLDKLHIPYQEWQVGLGVAYKYTLFCSKIALVPYMGVTWSRSTFSLADLSLPNITFDDVHSRHSWGYSLGGTFILSNLIGITVEGRYCNEKALSVIGEFRF